MTTITDLRPWFGWSTVRAALTASSDRAIVIEPNDSYGLRSQAERIQLRDALAPRYDVKHLLRSFDGTDAAVVVLHRQADDGSVAAYVWNRPHGRLANTWREGLIAAAHRLIDLPVATLLLLRSTIDEAHAECDAAK